MKPDTQTLNVNIESVPSQDKKSGEYAIENNNIEMTSGINAESEARATEQNSISSDNSRVTVLPAPVTVSNMMVGDAKLSDAPLVAKDDDLIEKEWVDKAKQIIAQTHDDPHQRGKEVTELHVDYLKKRFGKELGQTE